MAGEKTGRTPRHDPHHNIINTVHYAISRQHGRIDSGLVALLALGFVAGWLLAAGGAR
ncbi:MAG: hypothetical protein WCY08_06615 [Rhodocyclaceae bacterium]